MTVAFGSVASHADIRVEVPAFTMPARVHDDAHLLLWQVRGETRFLLDGALSLTVKAGLALWLPQGVTHTFTVGRNSILLPMFFSADEVVTTVDRPTLVPLDEHAELACMSLIGTYYTLLRPPVDLQAVVLSLVEAEGNAPEGIVIPRHAEAARVARSVIFDPSDRRTLQDWAIELHLSARSLERAFANDTGLSWQQWRLAVRMAKATRLLDQGRSTVVLVAQRVGYETHSAFTRAFRDYFGYTPSDYLNRRRSEKNPSDATA